MPTPTSTLILKPLKIRVVNHQPDQFRKGALSNQELSAIKQAIKTIPWSRNSNPKAAADEDYAAIVKECAKSCVHDLMPDLITEAVSNDYQLNNEAANGAYAAELNSDFENGDQTDSSTGKSTAEPMTSVESGLTPTVGPPGAQANATSSPPAQRPVSGKVIRSISGHARHRTIVRHRIVDVKKQLLALWHQSLAPTEKSP